MSKHTFDSYKPFDPSKPVVVSTGPRTDAGKETSSRDAMKHGCCSTETIIIPGRENIEDYKALEATWFKAISPVDDAEKHLVQDLVQADWFFQRATRTLAEVESKIFASNPGPLTWDGTLHRNLARFQHYQTARANHVAKCRKAIADYRKIRVAEKQVEQKMAITQERLEVFKEKNKPEPTIHELLQQMMANPPKPNL